MGSRADPGQSRFLTVLQWRLPVFGLWLRSCAGHTFAFPSLIIKNPCSDPSRLLLMHQRARWHPCFPSQEKREKETEELRLGATYSSLGQRDGWEKGKTAPGKSGHWLMDVKMSSTWWPMLEVPHSRGWQNVQVQAGPGYIVSLKSLWASYTVSPRPNCVIRDPVWISQPTNGN